jgi:hypothetical protein
MRVVYRYNMQNKQQVIERVKRRGAVVPGLSSEVTEPSECKEIRNYRAGKICLRECKSQSLQSTCWEAMGWAEMMYDGG